MVPNKKPRASGRNLQIRLGAQAHDTVKQLADVRGKSIAEIIREALEVYSICVSYAQARKNLIWEDPATGAKTLVLIPGLNGPSATLTSVHLSNSGSPER